MKKHLYSILSPPFYNLSDCPPSLTEENKFTFPLKSGIRTMIKWRWGNSLDFTLVEIS